VYNVNGKYTKIHKLKRNDESVETPGSSQKKPHANSYHKRKPWKLSQGSHTDSREGEE
jgi:hypothetical protein